MVSENKKLIKEKCNISFLQISNNVFIVFFRKFAVAIAALFVLQMLKADGRYVQPHQTVSAPAANGGQVFEV